MLDQWLTAWLDALRAKGVAENTAARRRSQVVTALSEAGAQEWEDLEPIRVRQALQARADRLDYNPTTYNAWLGSLQQFCRWVVRNGLAERSPLDALEKRNGQLDRRRQRRALTEAEAANLVAVTAESPRPCKMSGPDRAWLYALMLNTGLRIGEARQLTAAWLLADGDNAYLVVPPEVSKHRCQDVIPLPADFAIAFRKMMLASSNGVVFDIPATPSRMFRRDIRDANIEPCDGQGRVIDLHALRHTYVTNLVRTGAHPKVVQQLARHSSISLTMDVYSHVFGEESIKAVSGLPTILPRPPLL